MRCSDRRSKGSSQGLRCRSSTRSSSSSSRSNSYSRSRSSSCSSCRSCRSCRSSSTSAGATATCTSRLLCTSGLWNASSLSTSTHSCVRATAACRSSATQSPTRSATSSSSAVCPQATPGTSTVALRSCGSRAAERRDGQQAAGTVMLSTHHAAGGLFSRRGALFARKLTRRCASRRQSVHGFIAASSQSTWRPSSRKATATCVS
mmetsp:Transcript_128282/g.320010  ORF Transcript_128282/g.320010 Transcript_128282/m.320010 type:complete len:205 (+) Transcript_128282:260-874(+)